MKKEIGSEFWTGCSPFGNYGCRCLLPKNWSYKEVLSGRVALECIVEVLVRKGLTSVYMPSYCCHTMIEPFLIHGFKIVFYDVSYSDSGFVLLFDANHGCDAVFLLDYFGHINDETSSIAKEQKAKCKTVIYDATHGIYSDFDPTVYDYVFGSYRKWMDVNCGFFAINGEPATEFEDDWKQFDKYVDIRTQLFDLKSRYMNGEDVEKHQFLSLINEAEDMLELRYHHALPDQRSLNVLLATDYTYLVLSRRRNAKFLMDYIADMADERVKCIVNKLGKYDTPLFVPVIVGEDYRNPLRRYLIEHDIYCPVHWPISGFHQIMSEGKVLFESELSLICDQRYTEGDMLRMAECIKQFLKF